MQKSSNPCFPDWECNRFDLADMSDDECKSEFRFLKKRHLLHEKLNLPQEIITSNRSRFDGIGALCMLLRRLAYPSRYSDLMEEM